MKNITITRTKNIANATYLPYAAYKRALELATELKGKIDKTAEGNFKATFSSAKVAEKFVATWTAEYNANRKVEVAITSKSKFAKKTPSSKPTATKGKTKATTSSTKKTTAPRKAKGNSVDFTQFKGTKSEKNRALHAMLVGMGHADSRTPEYQAVWNARPWAK